MGRYERSIKIAFDKLTGEILDADEVFSKNNDPFSIRRKYHEKKLMLSCRECEQDLMVSDSKYNRLHFKHKPGHEFCVLADGQLTPQEHITFTNILKSKESERHIQLKNKIGNFLKKIEGVDETSIAIDNKFIIRGNEKRRPDVYCKYYDKELVFEIQLSDLSLGYILSRYEFYKKYGIYLIWILDNFDIHNQGTLERDIKYLTIYENFFKLDENTDTLHLECEYKFPFLTAENKFLTKWLTKSIPLSKIKFDKENYQIYYYNFAGNKVKIEKKQRKITKEIKEAERQRIAKIYLENARHTAKNIIQEIKDLRQRKSQNFSSVSMQIFELDEYELQVLNSSLGFTKKSKTKKTALLYWIDTAKQDDVAFIEFILNCTEIELDVNETNEEGKTAFQAIYKNKNILKYTPIKALFKRGYKLTERDKEFFSTLKDLKSDKKNDIIIYKYCNNLTDKTLVESVFNHSKLIFIIESALNKKVIGYNRNPNDIVWLANNAIQHHSEYWEYIELVFKRVGFWDLVTKSDLRGSFAKKVQIFYSKLPKQKYDFDNVFRDLFPEFLYSLESD